MYVEKMKIFSRVVIPGNLWTMCGKDKTRNFSEYF